MTKENLVPTVDFTKDELKRELLEEVDYKLDAVKTEIISELSGEIRHIARMLDENFMAESDRHIANRSAHARPATQ